MLHVSRIDHLPIEVNKEIIRISTLYRNGNKDPILFLHGLGSTKYDFIHLFYDKGLSKHTLLAFDFPGCGRSGYLPNGTVSIPDTVNIANQVLRYFDMDAVTVVGHSMGGLTGLLLARDYPNKIKRFINIEGNIAPEDCNVFSRKTAEMSKKEFIDRNYMKFLENRFLKHSNAGANMFADRFISSVHPKAFYEYCLSIVELSDSGNLMPDFLHLKIPCLFLYGEENNHLSYLQKLRMSNMQVEEIENSNHWPHLDQPNKTISHIINFVNRT